MPVLYVSGPLRGFPQEPIKTRSSVNGKRKTQGTLKECSIVGSERRLPEYQMQISANKYSWSS